MGHRLSWGFWSFPSARPGKIQNRSPSDDTIVSFQILVDSLLIVIQFNTPYFDLQYR
jgi:hypothetical protein